MMSLTDNESTTIREYIKQLRECAEFLVSSADDVEKDLKEPSKSATTTSSASASSETSQSDKKEPRKEYDRIRKCMKKIYKEAKQKVHNIGRIFKDNDENNLDTSSVAEEDNLDETMTFTSKSQSKTAKPVNGVPESEASAEQPTPKENGSGTPDPALDIKAEEGKPPSIRLVAIEKLLDPKVMACSSSSAASRKNMMSRELTPPPTFAASNADSSVIILDSDDEPEPTTTTNSANNAATKSDTATVAATTTIEKTKQADQSLPKVKPVKIRISKCKVLEKLVKADKRKIMVSKYHSKSRSKHDGSDRSSSKKRRRVGCSSGEEDSPERDGSENDSDFVPGSSGRSKRDVSVDRTKRRRESKDSDRRRRERDETGHKRSEPSTSTAHKTSSKSSRKRAVIDDGDDVESETTGQKQIDDIPNVNDIESMLEEMESSSGKDKNPSSKSSSKKASDDENESEVPDSDRENASKPSNKDKGDDGAADASSSSDEAIINIKRKVVSNSHKEKKSDSSSGEEEDEVVKKKHSTKRRRIRTLSGSDSNKSQDTKYSDDEDDDSDDGKKKKKRKKKQKSEDEDNDETPTKRKNIRTVIKTKNLVEDTKKAAEAEKERRKRMEDRQKLYNQIFEKPESTEIVNGVLDFDPDTKEELLSIDKGLLKKLKPHQFQGVKYMWDACFETIKDIDTKPGSGCILGHCMGLGKTLQVVTLTHTLLANSDRTHVNTVLVITPLSTVTNWANEFHMWMRFCKYKDIEVYDMSKYKDKKLRAYKLKEWREDGGVCILGYDMYRILANPKSAVGKSGKKMKESLQEALIDPGPDLVVCDEGHLLKNEKTSISQAVSRIRTQRRIVLSGTPLQNNLKEYYCMVQFVKPMLLGTYKEYLNRFVNPITNGQYTDSTERDIRLMKNRSHVLHKMLEGCIQRRDYSVLAPYLPPKHEYVIFIGLSELQRKLYEYYMQNERASDTANGAKGMTLFKDFQNLRRVWTHPMSLRVNSDEVKKKKERKALMEEDEDDMDDFINDDETTDSEAESSNSDTATSYSSSRTKKNKGKGSASTRRTRQNPTEDADVMISEGEEVSCESEWWKSICSESELKNIHHSPKLLLLFNILQEAEKIGDKVLLFSQSLQSLEVIESFLALIDRKTHGTEDEECDVNGFIGSWRLGQDYFRLDGSNSVESRESMCKQFNSKSNYRARLFLISTRAGSLGINLVAANRVIIFDASWNPSHDTQSIFRVYRFGQEKPCYIYRFIAKGTMEEKIYERQVTKQATAKRVIDEHQIGRHYNSSDLMELYQYDLDPPEVREVPILPKDRLFAELIKKHEQYVIKYHEHDSLLENKETETLSEEERKAAWSEYENEKNQPAAQYVAYPRAPNYRNGPPMTSSKIFGFRTDVLLRLLNFKVRRDHPHLNDGEVAQLVPLYLRQLYEQMNSGIPTLFNELNEMSRAFETPTAYGINPMSVNPMTNYVLNPFAQAPTQSAEPAYIHEID